MTTLPRRPSKTLVLHGVAVGLSELEGLQFDPLAPYTYCRICGALYQSDLDRFPERFVQNDATLLDLQAFAVTKRKEWSQAHSRTHPEQQHRLLALSGLWLTPEAAHELAAFGVIPVADMVLDDGVQDALASSSSIPKDDAEGSQ